MKTIPYIEIGRILIVQQSFRFVNSFRENISNKIIKQTLIYSLYYNFHRLQHSIEVQLLHRGIQLTGDAYDPKAFSNVSYVDVILMEAIQTFLKDKEEIRQANRLFVN